MSLCFSASVPCVCVGVRERTWTRLLAAFGRFRVFDLKRLSRRRGETTSANLLWSSSSILQNHCVRLLRLTWLLPSTPSENTFRTSVFLPSLFLSPAAFHVTTIPRRATPRAPNAKSGTVSLLTLVLFFFLFSDSSSARLFESKKQVLICSGSSAPSAASRWNPWISAAPAKQFGPDKTTRYVDAYFCLSVKFNGVP